MYSRERLEPKKTRFHTYETGRRYGTSSFLKSEFDPIVVFFVRKMHSGKGC
jgi:hypothetical protein